MDVSIEAISSAQKKITVSATVEDYEQRVSEKLQVIASKSPRNDHRPTDYPMRELRRRFLPKLENEVVDDIVKESVNQVLEDSNLDVLDGPDLGDIARDGNVVSFTAIVEVKPDVELSQLKQLSFEKLVGEVEEADVDQMIESLRDQALVYVPSFSPAEVGHQVKVSFSGHLVDDGFKISNGATFDVVIGKGAMVPGFEDELIGLKAGDTKSFRLTFPDNYQIEEFAGKQAEYNVEIIQVDAPQRPDLDETFFRSYDVESGGLEAFRSEVRSMMAADMDAALRSRQAQLVLATIKQDFVLDLPKTLVQSEQKRSPEATEDEAHASVKVTLIFKAIAEQNQIAPDEDQVRAQLEQMSASYENPQEVIEYYLGNEKELTKVRNNLTRDLVIDHILSSCSVTERQISYAEVVH